MDQDEDDRSGRATMLGALVVVGLLVLGLWTAQSIARRQALERCLAEGRKTCQPIPNEPRPDYPPQR